MIRASTSSLQFAVARYLYSTSSASYKCFSKSSWGGYCSFLSLAAVFAPGGAMPSAISICMASLNLPTCVASLESLAEDELLSWPRVLFFKKIASNAIAIATAAPPARKATVLSARLSQPPLALPLAANFWPQHW